MQTYVFTYNVPFIRTYFGDTDNFPLAMKTRCGNKLIYFVAQQKMVRALDGSNNDKVTVKYHSLISDGATSAVVDKTDDRVITGQFKLILPNGTQVVDRLMTVIAHAHVWSGAHDDAVLRNLITTNTTDENSYIISKLNNIRLTAGGGYHGGQTFIDVSNHGANEIITIHSLLTPDAYDDLREQYLRHHHNLGDIAKLADDRTLTLYYLDDTFRNSLKAYRAEVAEACSA